MELIFFFSFFFYLAVTLFEEEGSRCYRTRGYFPPRSISSRPIRWRGRTRSWFPIEAADETAGGVNLFRSGVSARQVEAVFTFY